MIEDILKKTEEILLGTVEIHTFTRCGKLPNRHHWYGNTVYRVPWQIKMNQFLQLLDDPAWQIKEETERVSFTHSNIRMKKIIKPLIVLP